MAYKMKKFSGFESSPLKQKKKNIKAVIGDAAAMAVKTFSKKASTIAIGETATKTIPVIGEALMTYDILKKGVKRIAKGIKTGVPQTRLKGDWKRVKKKKYIK